MTTSLGKIQQTGTPGLLEINASAAPRNGYAYVFISNSSQESVYFDDFWVQQQHSAILEENHYYAYGLRIAGISSKRLSDTHSGLPSNNYLYQGEYSEFDEDIAWNDFALRSYDPQIGRFVNVDPYDQFASPYLGMGCDPVNGVDPSGGWLENMSAVGQFAVKHFAPAMIGGFIGALSTNGTAKDKLKGFGIGFGAGMAASYIATSVNWGSVGNWMSGIDFGIRVAKQSLNWYLQFDGEAYKEKNYIGDIRQYGEGYLRIFDENNKQEIDKFKATSGPNGNGLLPNNDDGYEYVKPILTPNSGIEYETNDGFSFKMKMKNRFVGKRFDLHIHSTNNSYYGISNSLDKNLPKRSGETNGCIGLSGGPDESHRFYNLMKTYFKTGKKTIRVKVKIQGNKNIDYQIPPKTNI